MLCQSCYVVSSSESPFHFSVHRSMSFTITVHLSSSEHLKTKLLYTINGVPSYIFMKTIEFKAFGSLKYELNSYNV